MGRLSNILRDGSDGRLTFFCPGCNGPHVIRHGAGAEPRWGWNGDAERPVFSPSLLFWWDEPANSGDIEALRRDIEAKDRDGTPIPYVARRCHSFVGCNGAEPGQITFLADSTHALAGQTVAIPPWPYAEGDWRDG